MKLETDHDNDLKEDISTSTSYSNGSGIVVVDGCSSSSNNLRNNSPHLAAIFQQYANTNSNSNSNVNSSSAHSVFENVVEGNVKSDTIPPNMWSSINEKYLKKPNCVNTPEGNCFWNCSKIINFLWMKFFIHIFYQTILIGFF